MTAAVHRPDAAVALAAGVVATAVAAATVAGLVAGLAGLALLAVGLLTGRRGPTWVAAVPLVGAPGLAALGGAGPAVVLVGTPAGLLAWDAGHRARRLGAFGPAGPGPSVVHAAGILAVGTLVAVGVHAGTAVLDGVPPAAAAALLVAAFALAAATWE